MIEPSSRDSLPESGDEAPASQGSGSRGLPRAIAGVIGVAGGDASPQEKAAAREISNVLAQTVNAVAQGRRVEGKAWNPYSDEDSNIEVGDANSKRVKLDDLLTQGLAALGYRRVDKLIFRADWSTSDVEHFLRFDTYGNPKIYLAGDPGMRNAEAEAFAMRCRLLYARRIMQQADRLDRWWCPVHFSLGRLCGWRVRSSLNVQDFSPGELAKKVVDDIKAKLLPTVGPIKTCAALLAFLEKDDKTNPPLLQMGGYYRAAEIVFLARKLGIARTETEGVLRRLSLNIANGIDDTRLTPETYIQHILDDADAAAAQAI